MIRISSLPGSAIAAEQRHQRARHRCAGFAHDAEHAHAVLPFVVHVEPGQLDLLHRHRLEPHVAHQLERDVVGALVEPRLEHHALPRRQPVDAVVALGVGGAAAHRAGLDAERDHQRVRQRPHA
ncbi:MAG: hypothetical protein MUC36_14295 [Planctomycetes bacterium]|nr:hypothetical protein [Planctomycetota bacterium]